ncbi:hypothetical protein AG1IA_02635 [Rhizoctonia solani AG-1 IA]|uniref:Uncharacterized protein n=1 Tax=Thanatephorus cucumeris (strain AG1-IA) TaxID=983506 RepID=L8X3Y3_THACA|nr:hypothetical protein AG1IA_02635 [Rhizoctonia solani AG-1 IA]
MSESDRGHSRGVDECSRPDHGARPDQEASAYASETEAKHLSGDDEGKLVGGPPILLIKQALGSNDVCCICTAGDDVGHDGDESVFFDVEWTGIEGPCVSECGDMSSRECFLEQFTSRKSDELSNEGCYLDRWIWREIMRINDVNKQTRLASHAEELVETSNEDCEDETEEPPEGETCMSRHSTYDIQLTCEMYLSASSGHLCWPLQLEPLDTASHPRNHWEQSAIVHNCARLCVVTDVDPSREGRSEGGETKPANRGPGPIRAQTRDSPYASTCFSLARHIHSSGSTSLIIIITDHFFSYLDGTHHNTTYYPSSNGCGMYSYRGRASTLFVSARSKPVIFAHLFYKHIQPSLGPSEAKHLTLLTSIKSGRLPPPVPFLYALEFSSSLKSGSM